MLGGQLPKNRKFSIESRYYDPQKEEKEGRRIKFKRTLTSKRAKTRSLVWLVMLLAIIFYVLYMLNRTMKS